MQCRLVGANHSSEESFLGDKLVLTMITRKLGDKATSDKRQIKPAKMSILPIDNLNLLYIYHDFVIHTKGN